MTEIDGTSSFFDPHDFPTGELKRAAESFHEIITYTSMDPKNIGKPLFYLAVVMYLADHQILPPKETEQLYQEIVALEESFSNGSLLSSHLEESLKELIQHLCDNCNKARIVFLLVELEHLLCISSPKELEVSFEDFEQIVAPYFKALKKSLTNIEAMSIYKDLEEIRSLIAEDPEKSENVKEMLREKGLHL